eukprot:XP_020393655.1 cell wall protein IFF6-like [Zea mays]
MVAGSWRSADDGEKLPTSVCESDIGADPNPCDDSEEVEDSFDSKEWSSDKGDGGEGDGSDGNVDGKGSDNDGGEGSSNDDGDDGKGGDDKGNGSNGDGKSDGEGGNGKGMGDGSDGSVRVRMRLISSACNCNMETGGGSTGSPRTGHRRHPSQPTGQAPAHLSAFPAVPAPVGSPASRHPDLAHGSQSATPAITAQLSPRQIKRAQRCRYA